MGHDNAEGMAHVGVHVERPVRLVTDARPGELAIAATATLFQAEHRVEERTN